MYSTFSFIITFTTIIIFDPVLEKGFIAFPNWQA